MPHCSLSDGPAGRACPPSNKAMRFRKSGIVAGEKHFCFLYMVTSCAIVQVVCLTAVIADTQGHYRVSTCGILVGQSGVFLGFPVSTSFLPCHYNFINASHLSPSLYHSYRTFKEETLIKKKKHNYLPSDPYHYCLLLEIFYIFLCCPH